MTDLRARLRAVPTLTGSPPPFDPAAAPAEPHALFVDWLLAAVDAEVAEPCRCGSPLCRGFIVDVDSLHLVAKPAAVASGVAR